VFPTNRTRSAPHLDGWNNRTRAVPLLLIILVAPADSLTGNTEEGWAIGIRLRLGWKYDDVPARPEAASTLLPVTGFVGVHLKPTAIPGVFFGSSMLLFSLLLARTALVPRNVAHFGAASYLLVIGYDALCIAAPRYGRQSYDFQGASLMCLAPGQAVTPVTEPGDLDPAQDSWTLVFHPELIRKFPLGSRMGEFSFFGYDSHEALHVLEKEKKIVSSIARQIREEYSQNIDAHSSEIFVSSLELMLGYCKRFYGRQFVTRRSANRDVVMRLETFLREHFDSGKSGSEGVPTVQQCAREMGYSPNYLPDRLHSPRQWRHTR
jgi:hypothetical protein